MAQGTRTPVSGCRAGRRRSASGQPPPPGSQGRRPALPVTGPPAQEARDSRRGHLPGRAQPLCRAYLAGAHRASRDAGQGGRLPRPRRGRPGWCASARDRGHPRFSRPGVSPGRIGAGAYRSPCISRVPAVDLSWTWPRNGRPAANLTPPAPGCPAHGQDRDAARPGQVTARSTSGQRQVAEVRGRAARGPSQVCARSMAAGCMGFRTRPLPVTRSPSCVMTPGPAARPSGQQTASRSRRPCWPPRARRRHAQPAGFRRRVLPGTDHRPAAARPAYRLPRPRAARPAGPAG